MEVVSRKTQKENNVVSRRCRLLYRVFVVRLHWSTEKHAPSCHAGIFLRVMNSQIVYLSFFYTFGVKCLHTILAKKRAFLRLILIFEISHPHTLTQKKFSSSQVLKLKQALPGALGELARSQARNAMKAKFSALNKK